MKFRIFKFAVLLIPLIFFFMVFMPGKGTAQELFSDIDSSWGTNLYADFRSLKKGDIIMVVFDMSSQSLQQATLRNDKNNRINSMFMLDTLNSAYPNLGGTNTDSQNTQENLSQRLVTVVSGQITDVLPNGNLLIEAKREGLLNKEKHYFALTGEIRPYDVSSDNTISSSRIMNMEFDYVGPLESKRRPGIIPSILGIFF